MRLELGKSVRCTDGIVGKLSDIVIDPINKRVTHLVVRPDDGVDDAHIVPIERAHGAGEAADEISLDCTIEDVRKFENVREFAYLRLGETPANDPDWDVGVEDVLAQPYYQSGGFAEPIGPIDQNVGMVVTMRTLAGLETFFLQIAFWVSLVLGGLALLLTVSGSSVCCRISSSSATKRSAYGWRSARRLRK